MNLACAEVIFMSSLSFSTPTLTSAQLFKHLVSKAQWSYGIQDVFYFSQCCLTFVPETFSL